MPKPETRPSGFEIRNWKLENRGPNPESRIPNPENEKSRARLGFFQINPGDDRLSHAVTRAVPWALEGLTTVFGMGTGVTPPVWSPENLVGGMW